MFLKRSKSTSADSSKPIPFTECFAKTYMTDEGDIVPGRSVFNHCQIVAHVAQQLINIYPDDIKQKLFPSGTPLAAGAHDIGKVSPTFAEKLRRPCQFGTNSHPSLINIDPQLESQWGGHAGVSQLTAQALQTGPYVPEILGQHHGYSPPVAGYQATDAVFGGEKWEQERRSLVSALQQDLQMTWPVVATAAQARVIAGLTSVADWVGSGRFFENPETPWQPSISQAVYDAGFIKPKVRPDLAFEDIFGFAPRETQSQLLQQVTQPGIYVLEAPMGAGKTEAALYAAYQILVQQEAVGIYFALPTQLTSNKLYDRFNHFLQQVLQTETTFQPMLLHGSAWMLTNTDMGEEGKPGGSWFHHAKRGLLAPFGLGTIDQALMAVMNVKHGFVRAFGLAGKVVILDEVHTYDTYTGTLLDALIDLLRQLHCTVIILSATLNRERREYLLNSKLENETAYPLITSQKGLDIAQEIPVAPYQGKTIQIYYPESWSEAVEAALDRAETGQQILWIENTVREAQERYLDLAARASERSIHIGLLHSRYTMRDRHNLESEWVALFSKSNKSSRTLQGRILIGTQVLEQSLDIDADFMVTQFCPTDMLFQRLGRLWRHEDMPRAPEAQCEAWLLAPFLDKGLESPWQAFGASASIYSPYVLNRSLEVWQSCQRCCVPNDIRPMIEATYASRVDQGWFHYWYEELLYGNRQRNGQVAMQQFARVALAQQGKTLPENKAETRYSEQDTIEVLLLTTIQMMPESRATHIEMLDGEKLTLYWDRFKYTRKQWRHLSAKLMKEIVKVVPREAPRTNKQKTLQDIGLHHCFYLGAPEDNEALLRVALVSQQGKLMLLDEEEASDTHELSYQIDRGYRAVKKGV